MKEKSTRCTSLDLFRALMIINFVFFNLLNTFVLEDNIPLFLRHNQGTTLLPGDLVAPAFAFILGAALFFSYQKSLTEKKPFVVFMKQKAFGFVTLLALGLFLDGAPCFCLNWGVLQSLGVGGLFALLFIKLDNKARIVLGLLLLAVYSQISIYAIQLPSPDPVGHGGIVGSFGYGFLSIFGIVTAELFYKNKKMLLALGVGFLILAFLVSTWIPFDKLDVTTSFVLISIGFCMLFWLLISRFDSGIPYVFYTMSRHSLFLWILQYVLVWYPFSIFNAWAMFKFPYEYGMIISALVSVLFIVILLLWKKYKANQKKDPASNV
jgi:predicted acyltransferase